MFRLKKLIWIILIFWIVFFIVCDEKWIKIGWDKDHIVLHQTMKSESVNKVLVYKNANIIHINQEFKDPQTLRKSAGVDEEFLAKIEQERRLEMEKQSYTWPSIISINDDTIFGVFQSENQENIELDEDSETKIEKEKEEPHVLYKNSNRIKIYSGFEKPWNMRKSAGIDEEYLARQEELKKQSFSSIVSGNIQENTQEKVQETTQEKVQETIQEKVQENTQEKVQNNIQENIQENIQNNVQENNQQNTKENLQEKINSEINSWFGFKENAQNLETVIERQTTSTSISYGNKQKNILNTGQIISNEPEIVSSNEPEIIPTNEPVSSNEPVINTIKPEKYQIKKHSLSLKKWIRPKHDFVLVKNNEIPEETQPLLSDPMLESLLGNEEIDINTLESENDEFLQKVFEKTRDMEVMNLIVETYLNEYQFVKAKRFIENLPEMYRNELKPSLNLRVGFNSFALTSKSIIENLTSLVQNYVSKNQISDEDKNRYMWIIALMDRNYNKFFEIASNFTSEKNKAFASKLQWYREQIAKQMWMPEYYFDTLVSLELFNQWLFQPAKVLALYSLQQNPNYILPYQVLAYANFLTNSRDTSIEYLKKLVELDPNNAEKYRFLMWVAFYRDEKYEQSVVMLSMIKDEKLRLDTQRYLIRDYLLLNQKNKLTSSWNKLLGYDNLVASDFYTYFYEAFYRPYAEWEPFQIYASDTELANKMLRVCSLKLSEEEKVVCTYGTIGKNIALWQFDWLENLLLNLVAEYPQWYLYHALGEYYLKELELDKAKVYLLKAVSLTQKKSEKAQIKKLLEDAL